MEAALELLGGITVCFVNLFRCDESLGAALPAQVLWPRAPVERARRAEQHVERRERVAVG